MPLHASRQDFVRCTRSARWLSTHKQGLLVRWAEAIDGCIVFGCRSPRQCPAGGAACAALPGGRAHTATTCRCRCRPGAEWRFTCCTGNPECYQWWKQGIFTTAAAAGGQHAGWKPSAVLCCAVVWCFHVCLAVIISAWSLTCILHVTLSYRCRVTALCYRVCPAAVWVASTPAPADTGPQRHGQHVQEDTTASTSCRYAILVGTSVFAVCSSLRVACRPNRRQLNGASSTTGHDWTGQCQRTGLSGMSRCCTGQRHTETFVQCSCLAFRHTARSSHLRL